MISLHAHLEREPGFGLHVDLDISQGVTALYGPSGSGKTTILRLLAGLFPSQPADHVSITCDDVTWHDERVFVPAHRRRLGYVFQKPRLFPHLSVRGNLAYGRRRAASSLDFDDVCRWLDLEPLLGKSPEHLSGGEAQRVALGRVLLSDVRCILMDEPLGAVDEPARARILPYLERLHHELDMPMVYVSHSLAEVNYLADYVYLIEAGHIRASGSIIEVSSSIAVNVAEGDALAAVVECQPVGYNEEFELIELDVAGQRLYVTGKQALAGQTVRIRIPARDVSIALDPPGRTSILNIIEATIDDMELHARQGALVRLKFGDQFLLARITRRSVSELGLEVGNRVFAQVKGVALVSEHVG